MKKPNPKVWAPPVVVMVLVWAFIAEGTPGVRALQSLAAGSITYMVSGAIVTGFAVKPNDEEKE